MSVNIDGNYGEGGGSIVRLAVAFSILVNKPVFIDNIRNNRPKKGLKHQHVIGLNLLKRISNSKSSNIEERETKLTFSPGVLKPGIYNQAIHTAGSIGLIIQLLQIALARSKDKFSFNFDGGATFGKWAPSLQYLKHVTFSVFKKIGINIEIDVKKTGFYPKGGAKVTIDIQNKSKTGGLQLEEMGKIQQVNCISIASDKLEHANVAERQYKAFKSKIYNKLQLEVTGEYKYVDSLNPGSGICSWIESDNGIIFGSDFIGEKKLRSEIVGEKCADKIIKTISSRATVDNFLSDQLIPFMFITDTPFNFIVDRITDHTSTNIWLGKLFFNKEITIKKMQGNFRISSNV